MTSKLSETVGSVLPTIKSKMKTTPFIKSVAAGVCIGIGTTVYLSCDNRYIGAILFTIGLLTICHYSLELFTGKVGYLLNNHNPLDCLKVWCGNLYGCVLAVIPLRIANPQLSKKASVIIENKPTDLFTLIICGIFCGIIMFIAVDGYKHSAKGASKYLPILFGVPTFILCGFEHSIANMCYYTYGIASLHDLLIAVYVVLIVTLSNVMGAIFANWIFHS